MAQEHSAQEAPRESFAYKPTGYRRMTPGLLKADNSAGKFNGLPAGVEKHGQLLAAFKSAAPRLGISPRLVHAVDYLFKFTFPQDWEKTSRPIVWPSALEQQRDLGLKPSQVKDINRRLAELGLVTMKDSPNGKRYGHRYPNNKTGRITEAYGFDLSLFAARYEEFVRLGKEEKAERRALGRLKRRRTIAHKAIIQILETAEECGLEGEEWQTLSRETRDIVRALKGLEERLDEMEAGVASLERRWHVARDRINDLLKAVDSGPMGPENRPQYYNYKPTLDIQKDTVIAAKDCNGVEAPPVPDSQEQTRPKHLFPESLQITPAILAELAPRLAPYMPARTADKGWPEIVDAALYLSGEMGVNRTLWARACDVMGREYAAVAMAIVSTRPAEHFTKSAGSYFGGMVKKFEKNPQELCLSRTLWRLKEQIWGSEGHKERREVERRRRREDRTKKSAHPVLASIAAKAPGHPGGGFRPAGNVQPSDAAATLAALAVNALQTAPAVCPAVQASAGSAGASATATKHWRPSAGLLEEARQIGLRIRQQQQQFEEQAIPVITNPNNGLLALPPDLTIHQFHIITG